MKELKQQLTQPNKALTIKAATEDQEKPLGEILNDIYHEISHYENERERELLSIGRKKDSKNESCIVPWSSKEVQTLIRGVFRFGENEWQELLADAGEENE